MPGGEKQNPPAMETVNQAHTNSSLRKVWGATEPCSPQAADAWQKWLRWFDRYRVASGLSSKPQTKQVSTLLYAMGNSADDFLETLQLNEGMSPTRRLKNH